MSTEKHAPTPDADDVSWRPSRRGLIKAGAAAAAISTIAAVAETRMPTAGAASTIVAKRWTEATDGGVQPATAGGYRTATSDFTFYALGSSWNGSSGAWPVVEYSFSSDGKAWGSPIQSPAAVEDGGRPNREGRIFTHLVFLGGANYVRYRFLDGNGGPAAVAGFQLYFIDATGGPHFGGNSVSPADLPPLAQPSIVSRSGWGCPQPNGYSDGYGIYWPPEYQTVEHVILHHSETENETDGGDAVRSIYQYHTFDRGWGDIGYNYLVDKNGVIYEGRYGGTNVVGGHAFQYAFGSSGICAVGSFMTQDITPSCKASVINITAWVARALNPLGKADFHQVRSLPTICGHRDTNQTECPGDVYYGDMNYIRTQVANRLSSTSHTPPGTPGPGAKFKTGDNVIFVGDTRLHTDPSVYSHTVVTAKKGQYGAIDGAPRIVSGKTWQEVRVSATTEGYCQIVQLDFAPVGNPPAPIYEVGDTVRALKDMILRRSPGEAQNAPYSLSSGEILTVSNQSVAATGSQWVAVMSQSHATGYVKQEDVALVNPRRVSVSPTSGVVGNRININISGFPAIRSTTIYFSGIKVRSVVTNSSGAASTYFYAPEMVKGSRTVQAVVGVVTQSTKFTLNPSVEISPTSGKTGSSATVVTHGFTRTQTVTIQWQDGSTWRTLGSAVTPATGSNEIPITIPAAPVGALTIRAYASTSATTTFNVTGAGANSASTDKTQTATPTGTPAASQTATPATIGTTQATSTSTPENTPTDIPTSAATETPTPQPQPQPPMFPRRRRRMSRRKRRPTFRPKRRPRRRSRPRPRKSDRSGGRVLSCPPEFRVMLSRPSRASRPHANPGDPCRSHTARNRSISPPTPPPGKSGRRPRLILKRSTSAFPSSPAAARGRAIPTSRRCTWC